MGDPSGAIAYEVVAEELLDGVTVDELDLPTVTLAREYAKAAHKKWPPRPRPIVGPNEREENVIGVLAWLCENRGEA